MTGLHLRGMAFYRWAVRVLFPQFDPSLKPVAPLPSAVAVTHLPTLTAADVNLLVAQHIYYQGELRIVRLKRQRDALDADILAAQREQRHLRAKFGSAIRRAP